MFMADLIVSFIRSGYDFLALWLVLYCQVSVGNRVQLACLYWTVIMTLIQLYQYEFRDIYSLNIENYYFLNILG